MFYHIQGDDFVRQIVGATFPEYSGRKYRLHVSDAPINCASYWDEGSRSYFKFIKLDSLDTTPELPPQSAFDQKIAGIDCVVLPAGIACVEHSFFLGRDGGITIHIPPESAAKLLPTPAELTPFERIVLTAVQGLKASYGGVKNYRYVEAHTLTGIMREEWDDAFTALINRRLLDRNGAITSIGKNAIANRLTLSQLKIVRENRKEV